MTILFWERVQTNLFSKNNLKASFLSFFDQSLMPFLKKEQFIIKETYMSGSHSIVFRDDNRLSLIELFLHQSKNSWKFPPLSNQMLIS